MEPINDSLPQSPAAATQSLTNIFTSLIGGNLAGFGSILAGYPFDTIKVRMQMLNLKLWECCKVMFQKEGVSSFFKGISSPLITTPLTCSLYMAAYDSIRMMQGVGFHDQMTVLQASIAGAGAGTVYCLLETPTELVKCRLQMEILPKDGKATKIRHMVVRIVKEQGIKGLYRGNLVTIFREAPGSGVYFATYELAKMNLNNWFGENLINPLIAGGIAGLTYSVLTYPIDAIKTRLQCENREKYPDHKWVKDGGIISCAKQMWKNEGIRAFWRGLSPSAMRFFVGESAHFFVYESTKKYFGGGTEH